MDDEEYRKFPKITRLLEQDIVVTEKIDGTNGAICISDDMTEIRAGSRSRWITPEDDNYGFARWVEENREDLLTLGPGYHYGEWWGQGVQRKYDMVQKVFSLFNTSRWSDDETRPVCCDVVPVIYDGPLTPQRLADFSRPITFSKAAYKYGIEYENPEGIMVFFTKGMNYFKIPVDKQKEV